MKGKQREEGSSPQLWGLRVFGGPMLESNVGGGTSRRRMHRATGLEAGRS
ncbi:vegetative cell wall protein gp1-like [Iris pallida]|uniref:Vegetative cell wall protein gp1-like n=1 Tax=Iris pallida TaxID=29817 RepID=A0AAX6F5F6_IRIPA|nr:vegetative cell wall protein gp1-like [Iris pallida]